MATNNSTTKLEENAPLLASGEHIGTPENYIAVPKDKGVDTDALTCALSRAQSVCLMLGKNFNGDDERLNDEMLANACWTLEGLINQAQLLVKAR